ncbi:MAG: glycosyltransferase family 4 protein [Deltaproteobacteria bacterium]|nr:glycosyltransferase family 4 protein [Deltaproteobacteria bacterium]
MRILIASNRFFVSGGPERYLFNVLGELERRGHHVVPFALRYARNKPTPYAADFPDPPLDGEFIRHGDRPLRALEKARLAASVFRNPDVRNRAREVMRRERIEVVYALQIAHYLYPELFFAARDAGIPVVWRQSDFQTICPAYNSFRDGVPCHDCDRGLAPAVRHRCLKGSLAVTAARVGAMTVARVRGADRIPRTFACPSRYLMDRLRGCGIESSRLAHLPTPTPYIPNAPGVPHEDEPFLLVVGGLYEAKGPQVALEAAMGRNWKLVVAGDDTGEFARSLKVRVRDKGASNIEFTGALNDDALGRLYRDALAVIVPSLWKENVPNVVLEAHAHATPVVASNHGSLPEVVRDGVDGLLFPPGDVEALRRCVDGLLDDTERARMLGRAGREHVREEHDLARHVERLEDLLRGGID